MYLKKDPSQFSFQRENMCIVQKQVWGGVGGELVYRLP